ncbi:MAG TPA: hypothetical protein PKY96_08310 [Flavobacteriales bacterium]|nr:hypothetical protein [Flavobacteriales bacterium]
MTEHDHLQELARIRGLMDRSTRFLSLSGLSGVLAGVAALVGAFAARAHYTALYAGESFSRESDGLSQYDPARIITRGFSEHVAFLLLDGMLVLAIALIGALWFTWRRSTRTGQGLWDASARRMLWNLLIPLAAGGLFTLALLWNGAVLMAPSATLVFYGVALLNASKYTLDEIRWLGLSEIALGVVAAFWPTAGLLFWALGFGVLHIFYGGLMYLRHERGNAAA